MPFINAFRGEFGKIMDDHHGGRHVVELPHGGSHGGSQPGPAETGYTVSTVPPRGLVKRPLHEVRDSSGRVALTSESRASAERWAARLNDRAAARSPQVTSTAPPPAPKIFEQMERSQRAQLELGIENGGEGRGG